MSTQQQKAKVAQMQAQRKEMGEKLDWGNESAVKAFNAFQDQLKQEESNDLQSKQLICNDFFLIMSST